MFDEPETLMSLLHKRKCNFCGGDGGTLRVGFYFQLFFSFRLDIMEMMTHYYYFIVRGDVSVHKFDRKDMPKRKELQPFARTDAKGAGWASAATTKKEYSDFCHKSAPEL